jgi:hypothetical protein
LIEKVILDLGFGGENKKMQSPSGVGRLYSNFIKQRSIKTSAFSLVQGFWGCPSLVL